MTNILSPSISELVNLTGKTAIVTGGAMGIGQAICYRLAEAGAAVMVVDINLDAAKETAKTISDKGGKAKALLADASSLDDAKKVIQSTVDEFGGIDILVNNAGIYPMSPALDTTETLWDKVLGLNLKGVFFYNQAAAKRMIEAGKGGKIISVASGAGLKPSGMNLVHYDTSKAGVIMMTKSLATEMAPHKINVNAIAPGAIDTPGSKVTFAAMKEQLIASGMSPEEAEKMTDFTTRVPLGRMGIPDDIAKGILFLACDLSEYITGFTLVVDGGSLLM
ncbi:MAG: SDR family NAD(P)-dependent oxidoreductase [Promethearchaeota archaeon]